MSVQTENITGDTDLNPSIEHPPIRRVAVFITVTLALLMMTVDSTIVATALDALQHGLGTTINWAGWTLTAYSFGFVVMLPVSGKLSERYGRRRVFLASTIVFTGASFCCGFANNIYVLIVLRAIQAAGGAGFTPSATGIIVDYFGDARDRAVSLFGSVISIGAMIGPIFGGLFVTYWSWRGVFFVNVPIGLAVIIMSLRYIPRDPPQSTHTHRGMDPLGVASLGIGLLLGMFAISYLGEQGARIWSLEFLAPLIAAAVILWWFFHHIHRVGAPFIKPHLIHGKYFGAVNLFNGIFGGATIGVVALIPLYAVHRYQISALDSGTLLTAEAIAIILSTIIAAMALRRTGHRPPLYVGGVIITIGIVLLTLSPPGAMSPYWWLAVAAFVVGLGYGTINPAARNAGLQLEPEHSSTLAALRTMTLFLGSIVTISVATAVIANATNASGAQAWFDIAIAALLFVSLPLVSKVPEHHGTW